VKVTLLPSLKYIGYIKVRGVIYLRLSKPIIIAISALLALTALPGAAFNYDLSFWLSRSSRSYDIISGQLGISSLNAALAQLPATGIVDLDAMPEDVDGYVLVDSMKKVDPAADLFNADGSKAHAGALSQLEAKFGAKDVKPWSKARYGIAVESSDLRLYPAADRLYSAASGGFDVLQAGRVLPAEPCVILAETPDRAWFYVQTARARGWAPASKIAVAFTKEHWHSYIDNKDFLVVTAESIALAPDPAVPSLSGLILPMGTKLPLMPEDSVPQSVRGRASQDSYVVLMPVRRLDGRLQVVEALIPRVADVFRGHPGMSGENIIKLAMKLVGSRYGHKGAAGRDGYILVSDIFRCFGLELPMSNEGYSAGPFKTVSLKGESQDQKLLALRKAVPGSILLVDSGPMVFLGQYGDDVYAIAALSRVRVPSESNTAFALKPLDFNSVGLVGLRTIYTDTGNDLLAGLTAVIEPAGR